MIDFALRAWGVLCVTAVVDIVWARYTQNVVAGRPKTAGFFAALIMGLGSFVTLSYVDDPRMIVPAAAGAYLGTWLAVRRGNPRA